MKRLREQDKDWLLANYENYSQAECAKALDVSVRTVARWAATLGLCRNHKGVSKHPVTLYRKDCKAKKCCYLCAEFPLCTNQKGENPYIMVCWDFKLKKELAV